VLPPDVARAVGRYLALVDRLLPGTVTGFYVVGSTALGAYRPGRSDIDFVAVVDGDLGPVAVRRLRLQHAGTVLAAGTAVVRTRRSLLSGMCNGVYVRRPDLTRAVSEIVPVAHHTGVSFGTGPAGSDVSPVAWKVLADRGIAVRGVDPASLGLDPQPEQLRAWNLGNLDGYWRPWASAVLRAPGRRFRMRPRWSTSWGALGAPRLHCTIATGEVVSKEAAGEHALDLFAPRWHPLIAEGLAYLRQEPDRLRLPPAERARLTAGFVLEVIAAAYALGPDESGDRGAAGELM
jgi:Nucleotidyltransferase domain/Aminoglycoside adenylyltransferase, C-terminal domain